MRSISRAVGALGLLIAVAGCATSHRVLHVEKSNEAVIAKREGVFYALPRTIALVTVPIARVDSIQGKWVNHTKDLFNFDPGEPFDPESALKNQPAKGPQKNFTLGDWTVAPSAEADPDKLYFVELKAPGPSSGTLIMSWNKQGLPVKAKSDVTDLSLDYAVKAVETVFKLAAATVKVQPPPGTPAKQEPAPKEAYDARNQINDIDKQIDSLLAQLKDMDGATATMFADEFAVLKDRIAKLRDTRNRLWKDFLIVKIPVKTATLRYEVRPSGTWPPSSDKDAPAKKVMSLFRFSSTEGWQPYNDKQADVKLVGDVPEELKAPANPILDESYALSFEAEQVAQPALLAKQYRPVPKADADRGFYYNIPLYACSQLNHMEGDKVQGTILSTQMSIAQWGTTASLPAKLRSKHNTPDLTFDELTGALTELNLALVAPEASSLDSAVGSVGDYMAATSPAANLQREKVRLETEAAIRKLKQERIQELIDAASEAAKLVK